MAALDHEQELLDQVAAIVEQRDNTWAALTEQGWDIPRPQGNFVWFPTGEFTEQASDLLMEHGIVGRALGEGIRVSIGEPESVQKLLAAAEEVVGKLPSSA
jgi:histidinol-phosphate aminotransferase